MYREYLFQVLIALIGMFVGIVSALQRGRVLRILLVVVGILTVAIAAVWGGYELGIREKSALVAATQTTQAETVSVQRTEVALAYATQTVRASTVTTLDATKLATSIPAQTIDTEPSSTPTAIPETPVSPTVTPTFTSTDNTPTDTVLEVEEWWKSDGVWLRVKDVEFRTDGKINIIMEAWNKTGGNIFFSWNAHEDFSLTDNTGHSYSIIYTWRNSKEAETLQPEQRLTIERGAYLATLIYDDDYFFNSAVTDLYLTVTDVSRIQHAEWHIPIPK